MSGSFRLGRVLGIPIQLHYTWFLIFGLVTFSLSWLYFPRVYPNWSPVLYLIVGVATSLLFFASVVTHELCHSLVSRLNGVPVRSITLFIFGGVARITQEATRPAGELVMAAAGPVSSLMIAGFFGLVWWLVGPHSQPIAALAQWLLWINLLLAAFNLLPGFPLDGGRILRSLIWRITGSYRQATRLASLAGQGLAYLLIFIGIVSVASVLWTGDTGYWFQGAWLAFIGWFLNNAASTSYRQAMLRESLRQFTAREVMTRDCPAVSPELTIGQLVKEHVLPSGRRCFLVVDWGRLEGIMTMDNIKSVRRDHWDSTHLVRAMTPLERLKVAHPTEDAATLLERMDEEEINQMPVVEEGRVIGMVLRDGLLHFVRTRSELGA